MALIRVDKKVNADIFAFGVTAEAGIAGGINTNALPFWTATASITMDNTVTIEKSGSNTIVTSTVACKAYVFGNSTPIDVPANTATTLGAVGIAFYLIAT